VAADKVTSEMRRKAKVINFGILYGMGVNALRSNLGGDTSREEAQEFLNAYFNTFTRLAEYLEETKQEARDLGYTQNSLWSGGVIFLVFVPMLRLFGHRQNVWRLMPLYKVPLLMLCEWQ
jgi:hypothetical protein